MDHVVCTVCNSSAVRKSVVFESRTIFYCRHCRNAFTFPKPVPPDYTEEDFQARNEDKEKLTSLSELPEEIRTSYRIQRSMILRKVKAGSSVLEIGGGEGIFLDLLRESGYETQLIEPSKTASKRAEKRGLNVHHGYFQEVKLEKKFDVLCLGHVLEHIDNPMFVMNTLKGYLKPKGFILLTQTNINGFMPRFLRDQWYGWVPDQHFTHFSLPGIKFLARQTGFNVADYRYSRLVHPPSIYQRAVKFIPILQDQIHVLLQPK